jgi:hypothetical protein
MEPIVKIPVEFEVAPTHNGNPLGVSYKVYTATLEINSNVLTATILGENTIGNIQWSRVTEGVFIGILFKFHSI